MQRSSNLHDSSDNGKQSDEANRGVSGGGNMKNQIPEASRLKAAQANKQDDINCASRLTVSHKKSELVHLSLLSFTASFYSICDNDERDDDFDVDSDASCFDPILDDDVDDDGEDQR